MIAPTIRRWPRPRRDDPPDKLLRRLLSCPYLRRPFALTGGVRRATLYATARGVLEMELNGTRVGDAVLAPGWTDYRTRIEYAAHDVSALLRDGENVLGAILGPGWYAGFVGMNPLRRGNHYGEDPALLCELHVEHDDGSVRVIGSDESWRAATGPLEYSDLLVGERYDARRELGAWSEPGFRDDGWTPVTAAPLDDVRLVPERSQPMRVTEDLRPIAITERAPGAYVVDLGQNMVGHVRLAVEGERGTEVRLRFAEMIEPDGSLYVENLRGARQEDAYVLRGGGPEVYEPRFTFHGFRYVEVTGLARRAGPGDDHGPRRALRHAAQRMVRVLGRARQPALAQHQLGPAGQLHLRADRLPAARRAARLARRRAGLPPHRDAQHGRQRLRHQVG